MNLKYFVICTTCCKNPFRPLLMDLTNKCSKEKTDESMRWNNKSVR